MPVVHDAPHPHVERRNLIVPGIRSSRLHVLDTKADPAHPKLIRTIEAEELANRAGYSRPHTVHCGPEGIYVSALADAEGKRPGGVFLMDHESFDVRGRWELDRGPQELAYDFWWHLGYDTMVSSEWGTPDMIEDGLIPEKILGSEYGHRLHFWDLLKRRHTQEIDLGKEYQLVFELRPAHDPTKAYGFAGVVLCLQDLSSSVFLWHRDGDRWAVTKVISIPAEPADPDQLPPMLKGFKACPPFVTDIDLSVESPTRSSRNLRGNCALVALSHALRIRRAVSRLMVDRRWWRSVVMDTVSTSPILSTAQSMTNSIPMGSRAGW